MNPENSPANHQLQPKEKLATDTTTIIAWVAEEMGYSRDKTKGYEEKLTRLGRSPQEDLSVFNFMGGYWHRFRVADEGLAGSTEQIAADRSLQALAKVVAGLSDKIALAMWYEKRQSQPPTAGIDTGPLIFKSLDLVNDQISQTSDLYPPAQLESFIKSPAFDGNPMGQAILGLHQILASRPNSFSEMQDTALGGTVAGVLMLQHYANNLESSGLAVKLPKPGLGSGNIESW